MSLPLTDYQAPTERELEDRLKRLLEQSRRRRSIREFSERPIDRAIIETCLRIANTAPSGANQQPWHFAAVHDPSIKAQIRRSAEEEEREFYEHRAPQAWLDALTSFETDARKPFLETAPWLIAVFTQSRGTRPDGTTFTHYYPRESVGIATGILIQAIHLAGLACLTHTPSPMGFLNQILHRPSHEKPFLLLVVGYPAEDARLPEITKKSLVEISSFH